MSFHVDTPGPTRKGQPAVAIVFEDGELDACYRLTLSQALKLADQIEAAVNRIKERKQK